MLYLLATSQQELKLFFLTLEFQQLGIRKLFPKNILGACLQLSQIRYFLLGIVPRRLVCGDDSEIDSEHQLSCRPFRRRSAASRDQSVDKGPEHSTFCLF